MLLSLYIFFTLMSSKYDAKPRNPDDDNKKKLVEMCSFTECCKRGEREREIGQRGQKRNATPSSKESEREKLFSFSFLILEILTSFFI